MANELNDFRIINAYGNDTDLILKPSDFDCYNELSYITSPSRDNQFELNNEDIIYKYIPKISFTFNYMNDDTYKVFIRAINKPNFSIKYYDVEILQFVTRSFYCSSKSYDDIDSKGKVVLGYKSVKAEFISINAYNDYNELKSSTPVKETIKSVITARIYFANPSGIIINSITTTNSISPISTFKGGSYNQSQIGKVSLGSHIYLWGTPFDNSTFGNIYYGMILNSSRSSETASTDGDYPLESNETIVINITGSGKIFLRFDYLKRLFATKYSLNSIDFTNDDELIELNLQNGDNTIVFKALNKPKEYLRINTITSSLVIDYKTTDYLKDFSFEISATNENGKAQYGLSLCNASIQLYDKSNVISELAADSMIDSSTQVELYLNKQGDDLSDRDRISLMTIDTYDYVDSSYSHNIKINLKDSVEKTNDLTLNFYSTNITSAGRELYDRLVNICYSNGILLNSPSYFNNVSGNYILSKDSTTTIYNSIDYYAKMYLIYMYSDGNGNIKYLDGE